MKKTHTPGRWAVRAGDRGKKTVIVPHVNGYSVIAERVDGPNARLIAAAPDLLEAASWARDILVQLKDAGHNVEIEFNACERAIAKAEGRE